jgi:hypothetical protein
VAVSERETAPRDANGRLLPGHHIGRPRGSKNKEHVLSRALEAAGSSVDDARHVVVEQTITKAKEGDSRALDRLASWVFPKARVLDPGLFKGARTAEELFASVAGAMAFGALSPEEAIDVTKVVEALANSGEWENLRRLHERASMLSRRQAMRESAALPVTPEDKP